MKKLKKWEKRSRRRGTWLPCSFEVQEGDLSSTHLMFLLIVITNVCVFENLLYGKHIQVLMILIYLISM
jgi:hypothetical protein